MRVSFAVGGIPPKTGTTYSPYRTDHVRMQRLRDEAFKHFKSPIPRGASICLRVRVCAGKGAGDLDNFLKAISDALQGDQHGSTAGNPAWAGVVPAPTLPIAFENDEDVDVVQLERTNPEQEGAERYEVDVWW